MGNINFRAYRYWTSKRKNTFTRDLNAVGGNNLLNPSRAIKNSSENLSRNPKHGKFAHSLSKSQELKDCSSETFNPVSDTVPLMTKEKMCACYEDKETSLIATDSSINEPHLCSRDNVLKINKLEHTLSWSDTHAINYPTKTASINDKHLKSSRNECFPLRSLRKLNPKNDKNCFQFSNFIFNCNFTEYSNEFQNFSKRTLSSKWTTKDLKSLRSLRHGINILQHNAWISSYLQSSSRKYTQFAYNHTLNSEECSKSLMSSLEFKSCKVFEFNNIEDITAPMAYPENFRKATKWQTEKWFQSIQSSSSGARCDHSESNLNNTFESKKFNNYGDINNFRTVDFRGNIFDECSDNSDGIFVSATINDQSKKNRYHNFATAGTGSPSSSNRYSFRKSTKIIREHVEKQIIGEKDMSRLLKSKYFKTQKKSKNNIIRSPITLTKPSTNLSLDSSIKTYVHRETELNMLKKFKTVNRESKFRDKNQLPPGSLDCKKEMSNKLKNCVGRFKLGKKADNVMRVFDQTMRKPYSSLKKTNQNQLEETRLDPQETGRAPQSKRKSKKAKPKKNKKHRRKIKKRVTQGSKRKATGNQM